MGEVVLRAESFCGEKWFLGQSRSVGGGGGGGVVLRAESLCGEKWFLGQSRSVGRSGS